MNSMEIAAMTPNESEVLGKPTILMYSTGVCPYCLRAEALLKSRGVAHIEKIRVDLDVARRGEMMTRTGKRTVPQIYVGNAYVGGFDELHALDHAGKLDALLAGATGA
jgi:glutaredoxin 3